MFSYLKTIVYTFKAILKYGAPAYILSFGGSLGDNLLLSILAQEAGKRGHKNIWIKCDHTVLFENNPYVKLVLPFNTLLSTLVLSLFGVKSVFPRYTVYQPEIDQDVIPNKHIVLKMADALNLKGPIYNKPFFDEGQLSGRYFQSNQIVIINSVSGAHVPMRTKEWWADSYQQVVDRLHGKFNFIQLGALNDPALQNVLDLRGKTTIQESAAILRSSMLMVSHVGFMMHLARAVDCRSVIIYGGRETPEQSGYGCFENLYSNIDCSPCWLHNRCPYDKRCMDLITADMVENAIYKEINLAGQKLEVDMLVND